MNKKLVIIPSDPIHEYEAKGTSSWLEEYFNPNSYFEEVYVLSPKENKEREVYGVKIIPIKSDKQYKKLLKKINPFCVRAYGGYWATDFANYNRVGKIPVVSSIHDTNTDLIHESLKFSDAYFTMSKAVNNILLDKLNIKSTNLLGNRVDTSKFIKETKYTKSNKFKSKRIVLHVGRKTYQKNIENTIESLKYLPEDFILVLIGKGDIEPYLKIAVEYKVENRVHFIEKVENTELIKWYNLAKVLCVPSRWEGFGLVFAEAASCKTKIVTSNIKPMNEYLINDGVMNVLVEDFENPISISKAILKLVNNPNTNKKTREYIVENFDKKVIAKREIEFYKSVIYKGKNKKLDYKKWYYKFLYRKDIMHTKNRIIKLPKRIWRKLS
ncbi:hypothetical protein GCM10022291_19460 [Postechiella marina]|uniref:Glycosyl transferase family 1 domain-containing protein n=1 Tax=Postechiella marina TaxID=943941 RepID=A0ABP8C9L3_9FLAO